MLRQLLKNHGEGCIGGVWFFGLGAKHFACKDESSLHLKTFFDTLYT
jgi:hypothetical protein